MPTIIGEEKKKEGTLKFGATDPITGKRFEEFTPNITSEMLIPAPSVPFGTPQDVPVFPVAGLDSTTPPLQPTAPETQAQDITKQLQELNQQLLGQSTLQAEQEKVQGIPELQKTQTDLTAQLKAIQNEALAIPLQLQKEATGRGITVGGLQPLQTERLRTNAIQALGVASLLEASRGNLATAQTLADRAVAQKFDPIKEEIAVKTANLELILKSPTYTLADKNRAQAQLDVQNAKKKATEKEETNQKAILATATEAAKNGADALTLQNIQKAKTPTEALQLAAPFNVQQIRTKEENKLAQAGYNYVSTPAERDRLKAQGYDILIQSGRTYAKAPEIKVVKGKGAPKSEDEVDEVSDFDKARQFIADNPNANENELKSGLFEHTKLNVSEINSLLKERVSAPQTLESFRVQIKTALQEQKDFGLSRDEAKKRIKAQYEKEFDTLPDTIKNAIEDSVVEIYGRTFWQKLFPGGR